MPLPPRQGRKPQLTAPSSIRTSFSIDTGDGILLVQLVKRELEDTPEFQIKATQQYAPVLSAQTRAMLMMDWLKACIAKYKVEIAPIANQQR